MPRPRKAIRPTDKSLSLPADLVLKVDLELYSDVEQRVPVGAWSKLVDSLLRQWLARRGKEQGLAPAPAPRPDPLAELEADDATPAA